MRADLNWSTAACSVKPQPSWERSVVAKLTESDVYYIRRNCIPGHGILGFSTMGYVMGVAVSTVRDVYRRISWRHLP